jgi:hypothetical protein
MPLANEPNEDQTGVEVIVCGGLPADGQDLGAAADTGDTARAEEAQVAQERASPNLGKTRRVVLLKQAEVAAARLNELMAKLAGTWVSPLADTKPRVVALAAHLVLAAECLETVRESLVSPAGQPDPAREQMLRAEAHWGFARLHLAAAQRYQAPAEEQRAPSSAPPVPAEVQLVRALEEAQVFKATASGPQASWTQQTLRRTACVSYVALEACKMAARAGWDPRCAAAIATYLTVRRRDSTQPSGT